MLVVINGQYPGPRHAVLLCITVSLFLCVHWKVSLSARPVPGGHEGMYGMFVIKRCHLLL